MTSTPRQNSKHKRGVTALSYGLIVGLIAVVAIAAITQIGSTVQSLFNTTSDAIDIADLTGGGSTTATPEATPEFSFTTHTFTPCGATGRDGPLEVSCESSYSGAGFESNDSFFTVAGGIQLFTIPETGNYRITAAGAEGGTGSSGNTPGAGATMAGTFALTAGDTLKILVGQRGEDNSLTSNGGSGGGGGGSFVTTDTDSILVIAGGGAGSTYTGCGTGSTPGGGVTSTSTEQSHYTTTQFFASVAGPNGGLAGNAGSSTNPSGGGGAGFSGDGTVRTDYGPGNFGEPALSFLNGGQGGGDYPNRNGAEGGFGGGGAGNGQPGPGGGYAGGSQTVTWCWNSGSPYISGGSSLNNGTSPANSANNNAGDGFVTITKL